MKKEPNLNAEKLVLAKEEKFPCVKCGRIFLKFQARNLHLSRMHNIKTVKYTPMPAKRKVGRPQTRFICDVCNIKLITESELRNHMTMVHSNNMKRTRSEKKQETI